LKIRTTAVGADSLLAQIIAMVEEAQGTEAPIQRVADKVSAIFVPVVIVIAVVGFFFWLFLGSVLGLLPPEVSPLTFAVYATTSVLIIACPCALGLATPTAIVVGTGRAARAGILIKSAQSLEQTQAVRHILLDKTGTITEGKPKVVEQNYFSDKAKAGALVWAMEHGSDHPIAQALSSATKKYKDHTLVLENFREKEGAGVEGEIDGKIVHILKYTAAKEQVEFSEEVERVCREMMASGQTLAVLLVEKKVSAVFGINDTIKETSKDAVSELHTMGIDVTMITGDHKAAAEAIAREVGVDHVRADVLPQEKDAVVQELQKAFGGSGLVAMVGDGINDAPALARADVGIAMGTGTDVAIESADAVIVGGSLGKVVELLDISRRTMRTIKQNLFWAFGYNVIAIPIALGVLYPFTGMLLSPIIASLAMAFSSISVVLNSLRLRWKTR
jgi:heavy metal translocating P-type ATPase